jgi:hypothetical protein
MKGMFHFRQEIGMSQHPGCRTVFGKAVPSLKHDWLASEKEDSRGLEIQ